MTGPMTSGEIEDVLSSIRRLVSDDRRAPPREADTPAPSHGRLLLTPAQRVATTAQALVSAPSVPPPAGAPAARIGSVLSAIAAGVPAGGWEAETGDRVSGRWSGPAAAWDAPPGGGRIEPGYGDGPGADPGGEFSTHRDAPAQAAIAEALAAFEDEDTDDEPQSPGIDPEMLREIVRDVLREELQGAMGERITRNVRKLVHAEVARALAAARIG